MQQVDLMIIGGGPGGYVAALRAAKAGLSVALAEKRAVGGVCLNEGCIPSKALLNSAKIYAHTAHGEKYGVTAESLTLDHSVVMKRKVKAVRTLVTGVKGQLKKAGVLLHEAEAQISGPQEGGFAVSVGEESYLARDLIIATGSEVLLPPLPGLPEALESGFAITSREVLELDQVPEKLVIVGGGVIGLEMATYYQIAGSQVTVVEMLDQVGGPIDSEIAAVLQQHVKKLGVQFLLSSRVTGLEAGRVLVEQAEGVQALEADKVLLCVGRRPVTEGFGLETLGVTLERGAIVTDDQLRTNVAHVYAIGDVNGKWMLAHTASREGEVVINNLAGGDDRMSYAAIPQVIYTQPEVAQVGETAATAAAKGFKTKVVTLPMAYSGRYVAENDPSRDFCRVVVEEVSGVVLGVALITPYASEIIPSAVMMVEQRQTIDRVRKIIFPHPTVAEIIKEAVWEVE